VKAIKNSKQLAKVLGPNWQPREGQPAAEATMAHTKVHGPYGVPGAPIWLATYGNCSGDGVTPEVAVRRLIWLLREEARALESGILDYG